VPFCPAHCRCYCFSHVCLFEQINDDNDDIDDDDELASGDGMSWLDPDAMGEDGTDKDRLANASEKDNVFLEGWNTSHCHFDTVSL